MEGVEMTSCPIFAIVVVVFWRGGLLPPASRRGRLRAVCVMAGFYAKGVQDAGGKTGQRLTLPCLKTKYHQRGKLSRPSSEWGRVGHLRHSHPVILPACFFPCKKTSRDY